jgi:hypothetical protein
MQLTCISQFPTGVAWLYERRVALFIFVLIILMFLNTFVCGFYLSVAQNKQYTNI